MTPFTGVELCMFKRDARENKTLCLWNKSQLAEILASFCVQFFWHLQLFWSHTDAWTRMLWFWISCRVAGPTHTPDSGWDMQEVLGLWSIHWLVILFIFQCRNFFFLFIKIIPYSALKEVGITPHPVNVGCAYWRPSKEDGMERSRGRNLINMTSAVRSGSGSRVTWIESNL